MRRIIELDLKDGITSDELFEFANAAQETTIEVIIRPGYDGPPNDRESPSCTLRAVST